MLGPDQPRSVGGSVLRVGDPHPQNEDSSPGPRTEGPSTVDNRQGPKTGTSRVTVPDRKKEEEKEGQGDRTRRGLGSETTLESSVRKRRGGPIPEDTTETGVRGVCPVLTPSDVSYPRGREVNDGFWAVPLSDSTLYSYVHTEVERTIECMCVSPYLS